MNHFFGNVFVFPTICPIRLQVFFSWFYLLTIFQLSSSMGLLDFSGMRKLYSPGVNLAKECFSSYIPNSDKLPPFSFVSSSNCFSVCPVEKHLQQFQKKTIINDVKNCKKDNREKKVGLNLLYYKESDKGDESDSVSPEKNEKDSSLSIEIKTEKNNKEKSMEVRVKTKNDDDLYDETSHLHSVSPLPAMSTPVIPPSPSTNTYSRFERIEPRQTEILLSGPFSPLERVVISADGNLQRIMSAYYNAPIQVEILSCEEIEPNKFQRIVELSVLTAEVLRQSDTKGNGDNFEPIPMNQETTNINDERILALLPSKFTQREKRTFCIAKSTIMTVTNEATDLIKQKELGIGQIFRKLGVQPYFELLNAGRGYPMVPKNYNRWTNAQNIKSSEDTDTGQAHYQEDIEEEKEHLIFRNQNLSPGFWRSYKLSCEDLVCIIEETFTEDTFDT